MISFVICTYNGASRLAPTLAALAKQDIQDAAAEVLVVDNGSTDGTQEFAAAAWKRLEAPIPLRVVIEARMGIAHARRCGCIEAKFPIICFVDDDNWLMPGYGSRVVEIFAENPRVAIVGGCGEPVFDDGVVPPAWFAYYSASYALGPRASHSGPANGFVYGAGMSIRRDALKALYEAGWHPMLTGRAGRRTLSGDDHELCLIMKLLGWDVWYEDSLRFKHYIPCQRLTKKYLAGIYFGFGYEVWPGTIYSEIQRKPTWARCQYNALTHVLHSGCRSCVESIFRLCRPLSIGPVARQAYWFGRFCGTIAHLVRRQSHFRRLQQILSTYDLSPGV